MRFAGKNVIVTGAARGIGEATARAFAAEGANVCLADVIDAKPLADELRTAGNKTLFVKADVVDQAAVDALVARTAQEFGRLDIMVANAAWSERAPFWKISPEGFRKTIDVTMMGAWHCLLSAVKQMMSQGLGGSVIVTGSPHADFAFPEAMPYNMAKAAVDHMARTAACELFEHKIRVNIVHPGWTNTPGERKFATEEELSRIGDKLPPGRLARPEEIARGILFLADDASEYINGATLSIDGGLNLPWQPI